MLRKILPLLALLLGLAAPLAGATRLYFPGHLISGTYTDTPADVYPTPNASWVDVTQAFYSALTTGGTSTTEGAYTVDLANTDNVGELERIAVSDEMEAGIVFENGVTTVGMQIMVREAGTGENVGECILSVRVMDRLGETVQATLLAFGNYNNSNEFTATANTFRNETCANGDTVTADYTTVAGDRLVVEVGWSLSSATGGGLVGSVWGEGLSAGDCLVNETTTGTYAGATVCNPWIEFSNTITFQADTLTKNRFYFPSSGSAAISPAVASGWEDSSEVERFPLVMDGGSTAMAAGQVVDLPDSPGTHDDLDRQYISSPMATGTVFMAGLPARLVFQPLQVVSTDNIGDCIVGLRVLSQDGSTVRATLLSVSDHEYQVYVDSSGIGLESEFSTTHDSWSCIPWGTANLIQNDYTTVAGDRLVLEIGYSTRDDGGGGTTPQAQGKWGESAASDCPYMHAANLGPTECTPWLEITSDDPIVLVGESSSHGHRVISSLRAPDVQLTALELSDRACGSSRDTVVSVRAVRPTERAIEKALRRARAWVHRRDGRHCICIVMTPVLGSDGDHVVAPVLIIFRLDGAPPKLQQPWRRLDKTPPYGKVA